MSLSFIKTVLEGVFYAVSTIFAIFITAKKLSEKSGKDK